MTEKMASRPTPAVTRCPEIWTHAKKIQSTMGWFQLECLIKVRRIVQISKFLSSNTLQTSTIEANKSSDCMTHLGLLNNVVWSA